MYRLIVTGSRDLPEAEIVWMPLWMLLHKQEAMIVTHGAHNSGTDLFVHEWFELPEQPWTRIHRKYEPKVEYLALEDPHPANWSLGKKAGPLRNQEMIDDDPPADACFAFPTPSANGTLDCMARAWVKGIPVWIWHHLDPGRHRRLTDAEGESLARKKLGWGSTRTKV